MTGRAIRTNKAATQATVLINRTFGNGVVTQAEAQRLATAIKQPGGKALKAAVTDIFSGSAWKKVGKIGGQPIAVPIKPTYQGNAKKVLAGAIDWLGPL